MLSSRLPLYDPVPGGYKPTESQYYHALLLAIRKRRVLIHGEMNQGNHACAVGALSSYIEKGDRYRKERSSMMVPDTWLLEVQRVNDSVPQATGAKRRQVVLDFVRKKLSTLGALYFVKCPRCETVVGRKRPFTAKCPSCKKESITIELKSEGV